MLKEEDVGQKNSLDGKLIFKKEKKLTKREFCREKMSFLNLRTINSKGVTKFQQNKI